MFAYTVPSSSLPPLDVHHLPENWTRWRQYFEIYVTAAYHKSKLEDREKLAIFLHYLGPDGIDVVNELFPQLKDFTSEPALKVSFSEVWNKFNSHCYSLKSEKTEEPVKTATAEDRDLKEDETIVDPLIEVADEKLIDEKKAQDLDGQVNRTDSQKLIPVDLSTDSDKEREELGEEAKEEDSPAETIRLDPKNEDKGSVPEKVASESDLSEAKVDFEKPENLPATKEDSVPVQKEEEKDSFPEINRTNSQKLQPAIEIEIQKKSSEEPTKSTENDQEKDSPPKEAGKFTEEPPKEGESQGKNEFNLSIFRFGSQSAFEFNGTKSSSSRKFGWVSPVALTAFSKIQKEKEKTNLSLFDLEAYSQKSDTEQQVVTDSLGQGYKLTIDGLTLSKYPIHSHSDLYKKYGEFTKNLEITGLIESNLVDLSPYFPHITELTLKLTWIMEAQDCSSIFPQPLKKLTLIHSKVPFLFQWMEGMKSSMESLHLEHVSYSTPPPSQNKSQSAFDKLKSFTVIGKEPFPREKYPLAPGLEDLHLDVPKGLYYFPWQHGAPLKTITLNSCWSGSSSVPYQSLKSFLKLRHLTFLNPVDETHKVEIEALNVHVHGTFLVKQKTKEGVNWFKEELKQVLKTIPGNLILKLSDKILKRILNHLPIEDWISLQDAHPRLHRLILEHPDVRYVINKKSLEELPVHTNRPFYIRMGKIVKDLTVDGIDAWAFYDIMYFFTQLTTLKLKNIPRLDQQNMTRLFRRLNPKLRILHLSGLDVFPNCLKDLSDIEEFKTENIKLNKDFLELLQVSQDSMRRVDFTYPRGVFVARIAGNKDLIECCYKAIGNMSYLQELRLHVNAANVSYFFPNCFPHLEKLSFWDSLGGLEAFLSRIDGGVLEVIEGLPNDFKFKVERFPWLKEQYRQQLKK